ncbi:hypothetical protein Ahy_A04g018979 isoform B [Arachis hypogaea]|uniref:Uncharacterized protein n=1 Tax=Arachis hypogaea TaxID=3818 RepID=A0A445DF06_ARAHY|nr:hypothetical protein Ahy_A04g018979 isoform B [Arachis hypogaea]
MRSLIKMDTEVKLGTMEANIVEVTNALANQHPFEEPFFMRTLDLEAMYALEFFEYRMHVLELPVVADGKM